MWEKIGNPHATFAVLLERPVVLPNQTNLVEKGCRSLFVLQLLAMQFFQIRFIVKTVDVTHATHQADMDDAFRFWLEVG